MTKWGTRTQFSHQRTNDLSSLASALCTGLVSLVFGACPAAEANVGPINWTFSFQCKADALRTDAIRLQVGRGGCPIEDPSMFEAWASAPDSTISRRQGIPPGLYAMQATALDRSGGEVVGSCKNVEVPTDTFVVLELEETTSCEGRLTYDEDAGPESPNVDAAMGDSGVRDSGPGGAADGSNMADASDMNMTTCTAASAPTWWRDGDEDGAGDSNQAMKSCSQPSGYVATSGDCNDDNATVFPGATESCDLMDSDCDMNLSDGCPSECTPTLNENRFYLICQSKKGWSDAAAECMTAGMMLVRIDSDGENAFVQTAGIPTSSGNVWLGGTDSIMEGVWRWQNGDEVFWVGDETATVDPAWPYSRWNAGKEPSDGSPQEDCTEMREGGTWNDVACDRFNKFVCERP